MLGLPKSTELHKLLPKKVIYAKFQMNTAAKEKIDSDISRITIVNEAIADKLNVAEGKEVKSFFAMHVILKKKEFNEKNIITISKLIPQNMLLVLEFDGLYKLAIYHTKLLQTEWKKLDELNIKLDGLNLDVVWENIIAQIGGLESNSSSSLEEQIALQEQKEKLQKEIAKLEKQARAEKQPNKKFDLVKKINKLKKQMEDL